MLGEGLYGYLGTALLCYKLAEKRRLRKYTVVIGIIAANLNTQPPPPIKKLNFFFDITSKSSVLDHVVSIRN
jgi:hypothetical protein